MSARTPPCSKPATEESRLPSERGAPLFQRAGAPPPESHCEWAATEVLPEQDAVPAVRTRKVSALLVKRVHPIPALASDGDVRAVALRIRRRTDDWCHLKELIGQTAPEWKSRRCKPSTAPSPPTAEPWRDPLGRSIGNPGS